MSPTPDSIPDDVDDVAETVRGKTACAVCGDTLFDIDHEDGDRVWVDSSGAVRDDNIGAINIEDTYSEPHNLDPNGSDWLCGYCADIDSFERNGSFLIGVLPRNQSYSADTGVLVQDTVVETHYLYQDGANYRDTPFKQTIEDYALDTGDVNGNLRIGEWFDAEERYYGNNWLEQVPLHEHAPRRYADDDLRKFTTAVREHDIELWYPALVSGDRLWVPSQHIEETIERFTEFRTDD